MAVTARYSIPVTNSALFVFGDYDIPFTMSAPTPSMQLSREHLGLTLLICFHVGICCVSYAFVTQLYGGYHLFYEPDRLPNAILIVAAFTLVSLLFTFADFSFGFLVGFYFYTMIAGYLWLNFYSDFDYDRLKAGLSAAASAVTFLLPSLFITLPVRRILTISLLAFDRLLLALFLLSVTAIAIGASYNFELVSPLLVSGLRTDALPLIPRYLITVTSSALLPFLFACFVARRNYWGCGAVLLLLLLYYPIAMNKVVLFTPAWLVFVTLLARMFKPKVAAIVSLLGPISVGVILLALSRIHAIPDGVTTPYFDIVNWRMIGVPSSAMDLYNEFFSNHDLTYFCQIRVLKSIVSCPYKDQLSVVMMHAYPYGGNFNASLFATEGIASVGLWFAPVSAFVCGLVIALGNRLSADLPPSFILVSGAILPQIMLNVALSTTLLTHGAILLFLLWYLTPRSVFKRPGGTSVHAG